jgi:hypothetical protein
MAAGAGLNRTGRHRKSSKQAAQGLTARHPKLARGVFAFEASNTTSQTDTPTSTEKKKKKKSALLPLAARNDQRGEPLLGVRLFAHACTAGNAC